jgi:diguanylate cyclase (GGDEF)-like protein
LNDWIVRPSSIVAIIVGLFILVSGIAAFLCFREFDATRDNVLSADEVAADLLANIVHEQERAVIGILESYSHRRLFIEAVRRKDRDVAHRHLADLKKNHEIDLTFVTDNKGVLWTNYPPFPEAIGRDLSNRDWYKGVSAEWTSYVSTVFKLIVGDKPPAVAVCVPIFDEKGRIIGILGSSQRLAFLVENIRRVSLIPNTTVSVIDRTGNILYSNKFSYQGNIIEHPSFSSIEQALKEKRRRIEMDDARDGRQISYLAVVPVEAIGWSVVVERTRRDILRSEYGRFVEIGVISLLLFLLMAIFLVYMRKASLFRRAEEILEMSLRDQLTELYNRRGFITLAEQQLKTANRTKRPIGLSFFDLDGLKWINDSLGHEAGDRALIDAANVLGQTFREADIIARVGGDEFAVLAIDMTEINPEAVAKRLQQNIDDCNAIESKAYKLAMSWGTSIYDPESPVSLDQLMSAADALMYAQKKAKSNRRS